MFSLAVSDARDLNGFPVSHKEPQFADDVRFHSRSQYRQRIADIVTANGIERRQQIEALYERPENRLNLERRIQQEKTLRFVIDKAKVKIVESQKDEAQI